MAAKRPPVRDRRESAVRTARIPGARKRAAAKRTSQGSARSGSALADSDLLRKRSREGRISEAVGVVSRRRIPYSDGASARDACASMVNVGIVLRSAGLPSWSRRTRTMRTDGLQRGALARRARSSARRTCREAQRRHPPTERAPRGRGPADALVGVMHRRSRGGRSAQTRTLPRQPTWTRRPRRVVRARPGRGSRAESAPSNARRGEGAFRSGDRRRPLTHLDLLQLPPRARSWTPVRLPIIDDRAGRVGLEGEAIEQAAFRRDRTIPRHRQPGGRRLRGGGPGSVTGCCALIG